MRNLKFYVDDMIVKTIEGRPYAEDLEDVLHLTRKFYMLLNHAKCSFGGQDGKFLKIMVTTRGI